MRSLMMLAALLVPAIAYAEVHVLSATKDEVVVDYRWGILELYLQSRALDRSTAVANEHCAKYNRTAVYKGKDFDRHVFRYACAPRDPADAALQAFSDKYKIRLTIEPLMREALAEIDRDRQETYLLLASEGLSLAWEPTNQSKLRFDTILDTAHQVATGNNLAARISGQTPQHRIQQFVAVYNEVRRQPRRLRRVSSAPGTPASDISIVTPEGKLTTFGVIELRKRVLATP